MENNSTFFEHFIHDSDLERLNHALEMFTHCVRTVEEKIDECGDYDEPTVSMDSYFEKKDVVDENIYRKASQFFEAIKEWMKNNDMNYDFDYSPVQRKEFVLTTIMHMTCKLTAKEKSI